MFRTILISLLITIATAVSAQERPQTILVLDGSGSMWGQIDGINKIVIAREVIGELLASLPADQELGLMTYGHRRKGDCSDIELMIEPGTDREAIAKAVNGINPRGKTPLSAAVIQAAEALRHTEERATVILVSDGIETCKLDPCAVGRELEATGVDFTAHVIGFDVDDPEALAQLRCLAEETGGQFRSAGDAAELGEALEVVTAAPPAPEPAPEPVTVTLRATNGDGGAAITSPLVWELHDASGAVLLLDASRASQSAALLPGGYSVSVLRPSDEAAAEKSFTVDDGDAVVTLVLPELLPSATITAPDTAPAGSMVAVSWTGPGAQNDFLTVADADMRAGAYHHYTYTRDSEDGVAMLRMPPEPGVYELRYFLDDGDKILVRRTIELTPLDITIDAPEQAEVGAKVQIGWAGPDYNRDYFSVAVPDDKDNKYINYTNTRDGNPLTLEMPAEPGRYEIRYVLGADAHVAARRAIEVVDVVSSVSGPATAAAGAIIQVSWEGPGYQNDYVSVARIGDKGNKYEAYTYTREGNPLELIMPLEPGAYELRYILNQDSTILADAPITVEPVSATLDAADTAPATGTLAVSWTGPGYRNDYVSIAEAGAKANSYEAYEYTRDGSPVMLQMPTEPGEYELRYVASGSPPAILASRTVTVTEVSAKLDAAASAPAGGNLEVIWAGPGNRNDFISIGEPGASANKYEAYEYTRSGNPVELQMPSTPGEYELRYVVQGTERDVLVRRAITVEAVGAKLDAAASAPAGSLLSVTWSGPGYRNDLLTIAELGSDAKDWRSYEYTREDNPAEVQVPAKPGEYELRYVMQGTDRVLLVSQPLTVTAVSATLKPESEAKLGGELVVHWSGPDYRNDFVAIGLVGSDGNKSYEYTRNGSPLTLDVPDDPGEYELRYVMGEGRTVLARIRLDIR